MLRSALLRATIRRCAAVVSAVTLQSSVPCNNHGSHADQTGELKARLEALEQRLGALEEQHTTRYGFKTQTGQGDAIFSWDEALTACLPEECRKVEQNMHGDSTV